MECECGKRYCDRCKQELPTNYLTLPPPYGSLNAAHPFEICYSCNEGLVAWADLYLGTDIARMMLPK